MNFEILNNQNLTQLIAVFLVVKPFKLQLSLTHVAYIE